MKGPSVAVVVVAAVQAAGRQVFSGEGWVAAKVPLSATAGLSLGILGLVLLVALIS